MKPLIIQMTITSAEVNKSIAGTQCIKLDLNPNLEHWPTSITSNFLPESRMQEQLERVTGKSISIDDPDSLKSLEELDIGAELTLERYGSGYFPHIQYFHPLEK